MYGNINVIRSAFLVAILALYGACNGDETVHSYGGADKEWHLTELNGRPFAATNTLAFLGSGQIAGKGPCNSFNATMHVPYPWFEITALTSSKMVCPALTEETLFFSALSQATLTEILGTTMILSNTDGLSMIFTADD